MQPQEGSESGDAELRRALEESAAMQAAEDSLESEAQRLLRQTAPGALSESQATMQAAEDAQALSDSIASEPAAAAAFVAAGDRSPTDDEGAIVLATRLSLDADEPMGSGPAAAPREWRRAPSPPPPPGGMQTVQCGARHNDATCSAGDGCVVRGCTHSPAAAGMERRYAGRARSGSPPETAPLGNMFKMTAWRNPRACRLARAAACAGYAAVVAGARAADTVQSQHSGVSLLAEYDMPHMRAKRNAAIDGIVHDVEAGARIELTCGCPPELECHVDTLVAEVTTRLQRRRDARVQLQGEIAAPMAAAPRGDAAAAVAQVRGARAAAPASEVAAAPSNRWQRGFTCGCAATLLVIVGCMCSGGACTMCGVDTCQCPRSTTTGVREFWAEPAPGRVARFVDLPLADPYAPVGVIVGEFSGALQRAYAAVGIIMLTTDYRPTENVGGLHYQGEARDVVFRRRWQLLIAHPTCRDVARSGSNLWPEKAASGSHWFGLADILFWLCAPADAVVVEQPIGAFERYYSAPQQSVHDYWFGGDEQKHWRLFTSDNVPHLLPTDVSSARDTSRHDKRYGSQVEAEMARSRTPDSIARAFAAQIQPARLGPRRSPPLVYAIEVERMGATYAREGQPLPSEYNHPWAMPAGRPAAGSRAPVRARQTPEAAGSARRAWPDALVHGNDVMACRARFLARTLASGETLTPAQAAAAPAVDLTPAPASAQQASLDATRGARPRSTRGEAPQQRKQPVRWADEHHLVGMPATGDETIFLAVDLAAVPPRVFTPRNGVYMYGARHMQRPTRDHAVEWGQRQAQLLGMRGNTTLLAGEMGASKTGDDSRVRLVIAMATPADIKSMSESSEEHGSWQTMASLGGTHAARFAAAALQRALTLREAIIEEPTELITGVDAARTPRRRGAVQHAEGAPSVQERAEQLEIACERARQLLRAQDGDAEWQAFAAMAADRITAASIEQVPEQLRSARFHLDADALRTTPFRHSCRLSRTKETPAHAQPPDSGWRPYWIEDILEEWAVREIREEYSRMVTWTQRMIRGERAEGDRPRGIALGADAIRPHARGTVWDLRGGPGKVVPWDFDAPLIETHLDLGYIGTAFAASQDRELFGMFGAGGAGVDFRDNLPHQIVIMPNLLSLFAGVQRVACELATLAEDRAWYGVFEWLPCIPFRCAPRGSTPRSDGGPPRGIVDEGAPRKPMTTKRSKQPVEAMNDAARAAGWGREYKPSLSEIVHNHAILLGLCDLGGLDMLLLAVDFKYFFHQWFYAASQAWKRGALLPIENHDGSITLKWALEYVMSMGAHPSSRVAQRFANELMAELLRRFDEADAPFVAQENAELRTVLKARAGLPYDNFGTQSRLADAGQFTDDPIAAACGVERFVRLLRVFYGLIGPRGCRLMLAKVHKMHFGSAVKWLGSMVASPLGCVWVPPEKSLKAVAQVRKVLDGTLEASTYRKLFGFLTSLLFMVGDDDTLMHELEAPLRADGELSRGPATLVTALTPAMRRSLQRWISTLLTFSGAPILAALRRAGPTLEVRRWRPRSDAAREPVEAGASARDGLGGALYHIWWRIPLTPELRALPIAVLEFMAKTINLITFDEHIPEADAVCAEVDAKATVSAVANRALSPLMRVVLEETIAEAAYARRVERGLYELIHTFGAGNIMADAASRGYEDVILELCTAIGQTPERIEPPPAAMAFIRRVLARLKEYIEEHVAAPMPQRPDKRAQRDRVPSAVPSAKRQRPPTNAELMVTKGDASFNAGDGPPDAPPSPPSSRLQRERRRPVHRLDPSVAAGQRRQRVDDAAPAAATLQSIPAAARHSATAPARYRLLGSAPPAHSTTQRAAEATPAAARLTPLADGGGMDGTPVSLAGSLVSVPHSGGYVAPTPSMQLATPTPADWRLPEASPPPALAVASMAARTPASAGAAPARVAARTPVPIPPDTPDSAAPVPQVGSQRRHASTEARQAASLEEPALHRRLPDERRSTAASTDSPAAPPARVRTLTPVEPRRTRAASSAGNAAGRDSRSLMASLLLMSGATVAAVNPAAVELHPRLHDHQSARALAMFEALRSDDTSMRIGADEARMLEMCELAVDALDCDDGELTGNAKSNWKHWVGFCSWAGIMPWRTDVAASLGANATARERESVIWINALLYIWPRMRTAPGRSLPPKPTSALAVLYGIRRLHQKLGYSVIPLTPVVRAMRKLLEKYRDTHGPEALQPQRKEPLTNELIIALIAAVRLDPTLADADRQVWTALWHFLAQTGFRKAEIALKSGAEFALKHFSWDNVKWRIGGVDYARLTPALYARLCEGDVMIVRPPPSKADPFGLRWGAKPIFLPYSSSAPICAARELAALEMQRRPVNRQMVQTFALAGGLLRKAAVDIAFKTWIGRVCGAGKDPAHYSVHSFRSYLATALAERGASRARIQAMLRWASDDAVDIYDRTTIPVYTQWVRAAASAEVDTIMTHHLPRAEADCDGKRAAEIRYDADDIVAEGLGDIGAMLRSAEASDFAESGG